MESFEGKVMSLFVYVAEFTIIFVPLAIIFLLLVDPCTPPFILSMSPNCNEISWMSPGPEIFVVLFESWMGLQLFSGTAWVFYILFAGIVEVLDYFQLLEKFEALNF